MERTLMAVHVADLTAWMPIDTLVERLRSALPADAEVNRQGTANLVVRGTQETHGKVGALLAELRMEVVPPPSRTRYFDVRDLLAAAPGDGLVEQLKAALPADTPLEIKNGTLIVKAPVETLDAAERWLADRRKAALPPK